MSAPFLVKRAIYLWCILRLIVMLLLLTNITMVLEFLREHGNTLGQAVNLIAQLLVTLRAR